MKPFETKNNLLKPVSATSRYQQHGSPCLHEPVWLLTIAKKQIIPNFAGDSFQRCQLSQENVNLFRNNVNNVRKVVNSFRKRLSATSGKEQKTVNRNHEKTPKFFLLKTRQRGSCLGRFYAYFSFALIVNRLHF